MAEPADEIDALRVERDKLREDLHRLRGGVMWVISDILRQQHFDPDFPEHLSRWMDDSILPRLRRELGGLRAKRGEDGDPNPPISEARAGGLPADSLGDSDGAP